MPSHRSRSALSSGNRAHSVVVASVRDRTLFRTWSNCDTGVTESSLQPADDGFCLASRGRLLALPRSCSTRSCKSRCNSFANSSATASSLQVASCSESSRILDSKGIDLEMKKCLTPRGSCHTALAVRAFIQHMSARNGRRWASRAMRFQVFLRLLQCGVPAWTAQTMGFLRPSARNSRTMSKPMPGTAMRLRST